MNSIFTMFLLRPYVFGFLIAFLFLAIRLWGWRRTLIWLGLGYTIAWASEALSIRTGFPYGWYFYKYENLTQDILVAGVPFWDSLSYTFLIFSGFTAAKYAFPRLSFWKLALIGAAATMLLDVMIDPVANLGHLWFLGSIYFYPNGGQHFGVPISNYIGWFFVSWLVISLFQRITAGAAEPVRSWLYPAFYLSIGLFNTAIALWIGAMNIVVTNLCILLVCSLIFARRYFLLKMIAPILIVLFMSQTASAETSKYISKYTRLTKCQVINTSGQSNDEGPSDEHLEKCTGLNGYTVYTQSGDTRSWLVLKNEHTEIDLQGTGAGDLYFPMIGSDRLEWRYRTLSGGEELVALIVRIAGNERTAYEKGVSKSASYLYVFRIRGTSYCLLDKAKTNDAARRMADNLELQCKP